MKEGLSFRHFPNRLTAVFLEGDRDNRSGRLVFLIECLLNQNARDRGAAESPAVAREGLDLLTDAWVGMVQIPLVADQDVVCFSWRVATCHGGPQ